jgi:cobalt/nickel transport system permease protein
VADGLLPWWVVLLSLLVAWGAVARLLGSRREGEQVRFLARVGVTAAALIVAMSLPVGPGLHLSLAPLAGMMLGPGGGFLAAFLANASLAMVGHGGLTATGVNGLFLGLQAVAGATLFALLRRPLGVRWGAVAAAAVTLGLAAAGAIAALRALPLDPGHEEHAGRAGEWGEWGIRVMVLLTAAAAAAEAALTAAVIGFLARVRSDLVHGGGAPRPRTSGEQA